MARAMRSGWTVKSKCHQCAMMRLVSAGRRRPPPAHTPTLTNPILLQQPSDSPQDPGYLPSLPPLCEWHRVSGQVGSLRGRQGRVNWEHERLQGAGR